MSKIRVRNGKAIIYGQGPVIPPPKPRHYKGRRALYPAPRKHPHAVPAPNPRLMASMVRAARTERSAEMKLARQEQIRAMPTFFGPSQLTAAGAIKQ